VAELAHYRLRRAEFSAAFLLNSFRLKKYLHRIISILFIYSKQFSIMERSQGARAGGSANSSAAQASATKKNSRSKASHPEGLLAAGKIINGGESRPAAALAPSKPIKPGHRSSTKSKYSHFRYRYTLVMTRIYIFLQRK